ncbi:secretin N-terminal domain-containing protein [Deinococcus malanensis]|uniref:secretin N-terminal domain-containing protein n=1 Tax=Deinococcus malanensis TaxID=1706855 RepID=UPI0036395267
MALRNADAAQAANQVKLFFGTPTYTETPQRDAQGNTTGVTRTLVDVKLDSPTLRVVPDVRSNSVIVRGTNKEVAEVERLLAQLDRPGAATTATTTAPTTEVQTVQRVYTVKGQQADITALLGAQYPGLKVTPVGQTGQLVITGPQNQLDAALTLLGQVDRPTPPPAPVVRDQTVQRVFTLVNSSAEEVKATLEGTLSRDLSTNAGSNLTPNATLINPLTGQPYTSGPLANVPVGAAAAATGAAPATTGTAPAATPAAATAVSIIADKRTNTLIVRGTAEQVAQVAELIPQLDSRVPQINVQVRIQEITESAARSLGVNLRAGFGGFTVSTGGGASAPPLILPRAWWASTWGQPSIPCRTRASAKASTTAASPCRVASGPWAATPTPRMPRTLPPPASRAAGAWRSISPHRPPTCRPSSARSITA